MHLMKITHRLAKLTRLCSVAGVSCLAAGAFNVTSLLAADEKKPSKKPSDENAAAESDDIGKYRNWLELSLGGISIHGDAAQFQHRRRISGDIFGGIEDLHMEQDVGKNGLFTIDARAIFDTSDYLLKIELSKPDVGFIRGGFKQYRTWYDGSGGYYPNSNLSGGGLWLSPNNEDIHIDRGEIWAEAGLRLPDFPEITFSYRNLYRQGQKDSTLWGDTNLTGLTGSNITRGIVPSFLNIDERRDIFTLDIKHAIGITDIGLGLRYEATHNSNSTNISRRPGETSNRYITEREEVTSDLFNVHAFTETRYKEKLWFSTGYSYTTMNSDIGGSRIYGATYDSVYDPTFARRQARDEGFLDLAGGSEYDQHVVNLNLMWLPVDQLSIISAFRYERQNISSVADFTETNVVSSGGKLNSTSEELNAQSSQAYSNNSESLELRFTGIPDMLIYARGELTQETGNYQEADFTGAARTRSLFLNTDTTLVTQKYLAGINWYPFRQMSVAFQYYHKSRENDYNHISDSTLNTSSSSGRYPGYLSGQNFDTDDLNARITLRPIGNLTLVSRYDYQRSTIETQADFLSPVQSSDNTSHIFSESVTWVPFARLYLQGNISYVFDRTTTPAADISKSIQNADNTYWNADVTLGLTLDDKTSLQATYAYYRAENYDSTNVLVGQPYGAGAEENSCTVTLSRQINKNLRWNLKYGYFSGRDQTTGGRNDYDAHLVYTSFQFRF
jgi:hypothetical protein